MTYLDYCLFGEIEFRIELIPGATLVAKSPYRLAPSELEELSRVLKELQDKVLDTISSSVPEDGTFKDWTLVRLSYVKNWKAPRTPTEVCSFLGLVGYYRIFIENFSKIAKSLSILTQKCKTFDWGEEQELAFQTLKDKCSYAYVVRTLTGHRSNYILLDFHPFGEFFASGSLDTNLKIWDIRRKGCIHTYKGHTRGVNAIRFTPDGRSVVSGGEDNSVNLWDFNCRKLFTEFFNHPRAMFICIDFLHTRRLNGDYRLDLETLKLMGYAGPKVSRSVDSNSVKGFPKDPNKATRKVPETLKSKWGHISLLRANKGIDPREDRYSGTECPFGLSILVDLIALLRDQKVSLLICNCIGIQSPYRSRIFFITMDSYERMSWARFGKVSKVTPNDSNHSWSLLTLNGNNITAGNKCSTKFLGKSLHAFNISSTVVAIYEA
ncbi:transducin/WD40 repeat-like superfamily protein [Tanacetum coccineum]